MKKDFSSKFEIRLDFKRETENPSRLFHSFAEIVEGVKNLDFLIARTVNTSVTSRIVLDDIEKGSLLGRFVNALTISEDGQIDNAQNEESIEGYIEEARAETLKFVADKKSSVDDLNELKDKISQTASDKGLKDTFNYSDPDLLKLAESINTLHDSTSNLNEYESYEVKSPNREIKDIKSGSTKIDINAVEDALTESEIVNESECFYLIKKPDFLGESAWGFKHGKKSITVKILHEEWLEQFHSGAINIAPGDSLRVLVRQTAKYNTNGYLISEKLEVIEVIDVIHNP